MSNIDFRSIVKAFRLWCTATQHFLIWGNPSIRSKDVDSETSVGLLCHLSSIEAERVVVTTSV